MLNNHSNSSTRFKWQLFNHAIQIKSDERAQLFEARTDDATQGGYVSCE
jgi:hypothetical protein